MKILNLQSNNKIYTSNVYLITGSNNAIGDVNTLVDVGRDSGIIPLIDRASTGVGKKRIAQVILTHSHFDHASLLPQIQEHYTPRTFAYSAFLPNVNKILKDGDQMKMGDRLFEVIYTPGHSKDSICLYCAEEEILFSGDTQVINISAQGSFEPDYLEALEKIASRSITRIYPGHGDPLLSHCNRLIRESLQRIKQNIRHNTLTSSKVSA